MKIHTVKIKNFKAIKSLEQDFAGHSVILMGDNDMGKSSVIQFIKIALGDTKNIPPDAEGAGLVVVDKDGQKYTFKVHFKGNKPHVEVTSPDGLKDTRKSVIAQIVGAVDFDIDEFVRLSDSEAGRKKQVEIYRSLLPEDVLQVLRGEENKIQAYYDDRTEVNRSIKTLEGFIKEQPMWGEDLDIQPVDVSDLQKKAQEAQEHNNKISGVKQRITERETALARNNADLEKLRSQIASIEAENKKHEEDNKKAEKWLADTKEIDIAPINQQIAEAGTINAKAEQAADLKKKQAQLTDLQEKAGEYTAFIEASRQCVQDTIREMDAVIPGLSFDAEQLLYNGLPVSKASLSTSELMKLGVAMKLKQNPILFIERGESLGLEKLKVIQQMAHKEDVQIIMEQLERGTDELKIVIMEDIE